MDVRARIAAMAIAVCLIGMSAATGYATSPMTKKIIAYVFPQDRALAADEVDATLLTRVNYAFANIKNGKVIAGFSHDRENFKTLHELKRINPKLEVLVSVGGWTWSSPFSDMCLTTQSRKTFIDSALQFLRDNQLDGLDIDWEYPSLVGNGNIHRPEDKENYTALLRELRAAFDREEKSTGHHLITSIAVGASDEFIANTEMKRVQQYVDSVNLMSYDYYEPDSDKIAGHHAPLYTNPADPKHISADDSVKQFEAAGVPARKLVLGVPFYGHVWSNVGEIHHGLYQKGKKTDIWANYRVIVQTLLKSGYVRYWDPVSSAPYLYNSTTHSFVSYEDVESVGLKCQYVRQHELDGVMFWDYSGDTDDHALLRSIHRGLTQPAPPPTHEPESRKSN